MLSAIDFEGLGATDKPPKKKKEQPEVAPPLPTPATQVSRSAVPKWSPYAVGGIGLLVVIGILVTSKGKN